MYDTCQLLPSSTKTYAGMELHNVAANLDFTGDGTTNAITYNKLVFGGLSNGLLAYNCALNIGNCR